jgi:GNAT superfamily N-acetyltransferase
MGVQIRPAQFEDVFQIERTLLDAARLAEFPVPPVERPYAVQKLMDLIAVRLIWVATTEENAVVGVIVLSHHVWPWNRQAWHLVNDHFWVDPAYRKFGTAAKLLQCAKNCAKELGKPLYLDFSFGGIDADLKDRFAKMQGFTYNGGRFCYSPTCASPTRPSAEAETSPQSSVLRAAE